MYVCSYAHWHTCTCAGQRLTSGVFLISLHWLRWDISSSLALLCGYWDSHSCPTLSWQAFYPDSSPQPPSFLLTLLSAQSPLLRKCPLHVSGNLNQSTVCRDCAVFRLRSRAFSCVLICFFSVNFLSHLSFFVLYSSLASAHPELAIHSYPSSHLGILTDLGNFLDDIHTPTGIRGPLTLLSVWPLIRS